MSSLIEWLESRRLFSATVVQVVSVEQAAMALVKEASQARIDAAASAKTGAADDKALRADLKRLKSVKGNAALLKEFSTREQGAEGEFKKDVTALSNSITKQTKQDVSAGINFILYPTSVKASKTLAADLIAIQKLTSSGPVQKLGTDVNGDNVQLANDLTAISTTDASDAPTVADATTAKNDLASSSATLKADDAALQSDLSTLIADVQAVENS